MPPKKKKPSVVTATEVVLDPEHHFVKKSLAKTPATLAKTPATDEKVAKQLLAIYENTDGTLPDMKTFETRAHSGAVARVFWGLSAVVFVSAAAILWQTFYSSAPSRAETELALSISGPETATIGQEVMYRVRYHTADDIALTKTTLELLYPAGFVFSTSSLPAANEGGTVWKLGDLAVDKSGFIDFTGQLNGNLNESQTFRALFSYTPGNFNSEFQKTATALVTLDKSPVELSVVGPAKVAAGDEAIIEVKVNRLTGGNWPVALVIQPASFFTKKQSAPDSDPNAPYFWSLGSEAKEVTVSLSGSFGSEAAGTIVTTTVTLVGQVPGHPDALAFSLASQTLPIQVAEAPLLARLVVNGVADKGAIAPGDLLSASFLVKNTGAEPLRHLRLRLILDAPSANNKSLLNWSKLSEPRNGAVVGEQLNETTRRGTITWTEKEVPELGELSPGSEVALDLSLPLKSGRETSLVNYISHELTASVDVQYDLPPNATVGTGAPELRQGNSVSLALNSDLALDVSDEITKSDGGETHRVTWLLTNSFHDLKDVVVSADIFGDFIWNESALSIPAGTTVFDAATKRLTWRLPALTTEIDALSLQFSLTLKQKNPTQTRLTSAVRVTAQDTVTGQEIQLSGKEILLGL